MALHHGYHMGGPEALHEVEDMLLGMSTSTIDADTEHGHLSDHAHLVDGRQAGGPAVDMPPAVAAMTMLVAPPSPDSSSSSCYSIVPDNDHYHYHAHAAATAIKAEPVSQVQAELVSHAARTITRTRGKSKIAGASKAPSKVLPKGHKPARGRGRTKQLQMMTTDQKEAEDAILRERCRQAARDFRLRRKNKISTLQDSLDHYKNLSETQACEITKLKANAAKLRAGRRKAK